MAPPEAVARSRATNASCQSNTTTRDTHECSLHNATQARAAMPQIKEYRYSVYQTDTRCIATIKPRRAPKVPGFEPGDSHHPSSSRHPAPTKSKAKYSQKAYRQDLKLPPVFRAQVGSEATDPFLCWANATSVLQIRRAASCFPARLVLPG